MVSCPVVFLSILANFLSLSPLSQASIPYAIIVFRIRLMPYSECPSFRSLSSGLVSRLIFLNVSFAPCHFCTEGHPSVGSDQLFQGSTLYPGPFLCKLSCAVPLLHTFLSAMVTRFRDPQYPRVLSFGFWRRSAARLMVYC
jgi:hypothetical protein